MSPTDAAIPIEIDLLELVARVNKQPERIGVLRALIKTVDEEGQIDELRQVLNDPEADDVPGEGSMHTMRALLQHANEAVAGSVVTFDWDGVGVTIQPTKLSCGANTRFADEHWTELQKHRRLVESIAQSVKDTEGSEELSYFNNMCKGILEGIEQASR